jgi:hypothetical protein
MRLHRPPRSLLAAAAICALAIAGPGARADGPLFRDVAAAAGLTFVHENGVTGEFYLPEIMGAGGALFDYDNDGDLDVFLVQSGSLVPGAQAPATHALFRNDLDRPGGRLRFTDVTAASGLARVGYGMGVATGDYDNDGDVDLYVTAYGPNVLYRNDGNGIFTDVTARAGGGLDDPRWSTSAAFLDYDRDGDLDLFVTNYVDFTPAGNKVCRDGAGARTYCPPTAYRPVPDRLFRNNGDGTFSDVTEAAGISRAYGNGLGVACADFDDDGWIDIYVANDAMANQLWINRRDGTFEDRAVLAGAAYNAEGLPEGSMGIAAGDYDNDGDEDLYVTHLPRETNTLYMNRRGGQFDDLTDQARLAAPSMPFTGFGTDWFDFDHDGWLDLFVANGAVNTVEAQRGQPFPFRERNQLYRNLGGRPERGPGGVVPFEEVLPAIAGEAFAIEEVSRGAAFGDVDNDGDIDILVTNNGGPVRLLRNEQGAAAPWLVVSLTGTADNRQALGARVALLRGGRPERWRRAHTDGSYLSASDSRVHFGLGGPGGRLEGILVVWPNGTREVWHEVGPSRLIRVKQGAGQRP